ncbi:hypothetical protein QCA50_007547 [Cerrena zonata]|uniref:Uncharacterized protein n=1 Tax=Cerrena zonata TaxID=2478898 RepID=A0AAW0G6B0_9APHY
MGISCPRGPGSYSLVSGWLFKWVECLLHHMHQRPFHLHTPHNPYSVSIMTATPINPNLTSSLDSLPLSDFVPYLLVASASTCGAFIWQTTRYLREASLTRKSHLPFGTFVVSLNLYTTTLFPV